MDRQVFARRLREAAASAREFARTLLEEELPEATLFRVRLNSSYDGNPLHPDERVYPEDGSRERARDLAVCSEDVAVAALWRDGAVPEWVDLAVIGETRGATLVGLTACGRFTANESLLYHSTAEGRAPFHAVGPTLPPEYVQGQRFSLYHRAECWSIEEALQLGPHGRKVWSLDLIGEAFDDAAIAALPELPGLELLELRGSPIDGSALSALGRFPRLRVLRLRLSGDRPFAIERMPPLPGLEVLHIGGLPARSWGFRHLARSAPRLSSLGLKSTGDLVLDGECPPCAEMLSLEGQRVTGSVALPRRLGHGALRLPGASGTEVEDLLAGVEAARALTLGGTPIDEGTATRLATRLRLDYLNLVDTGLDDDAVRRIAEAHPTMRLHPNLAPRSRGAQSGRP